MAKKKIPDPAAGSSGSKTTAKAPLVAGADTPLVAEATKPPAMNLTIAKLVAAALRVSDATITMDTVVVGKTSGTGLAPAGMPLWDLMNALEAQLGRKGLDKIMTTVPLTVRGIHDIVNPAAAKA